MGGKYCKRKKVCVYTESRITVRTVLNKTLSMYKLNTLSASRWNVTYLLTAYRICTADRHFMNFIFMVPCALTLY